MVENQLIRAKFRFQQTNQFRVNFDRVKINVRTDEVSGQGAAAGANLHNGLIRISIDQPDDVINDLCISQKVLSEFFALSAGGHLFCLWDKVPARDSACCRLPVSATPLPAIPYAVPWSTEVRIMGSPSVTLTMLPKAPCLMTGSPWS